MATGNYLHLDEVKEYLAKIKDSCARIYRPGMSIQGPLQYILDWTGDKNVLIGAATISILVSIWSFALFANFFAFVFSLAASAIIFIGAKIFFYKPKEYSVELDGENTILSFVKDVHVNGESEIVIHSQPGYGKEKDTFVVLQLFDSISILDCRNITSVTDKSYRDIAITFFHPVEGIYSISASSKDGEVIFEVIEQTADQCRVKFLNPVRKINRLDFIPS